MPGIRAKVSTVVPRMQPYGHDLGEAARAIRALRLPGGESIARGFDHANDDLNTIKRALRQNAPQVEEFIVTDSSGRVLAALGEYEVDGVAYSGGYFTELRAGDPYGESNPANAILSVTPDGRVCVGENGWIDVLDPFGESAAWLGCQSDTLPVTGAVDNGSGLIRLTVVGHTLQTGDTTPVLNVGGVPDSTGIFSVTKIDANHIDLQNSTFVGSYTSGGTINRVLHIAGVTNAAGVIRIQTAVAHGYESGDSVNIANVGGVTAANDQWVIEVIDSTHFDLVGSTFSGAYTSGGVCLRYFAGGRFETVAIGGTSFSDYRLRAFRNGDLRIRNADIELFGSNSTITLDPDTGTIIVADATGSGFHTEISEGVITIYNNTTADDSLLLQPGFVQMYRDGLAAVVSSEMFDVHGYTGATEFGPLVSLAQGRGTIATPSDTQSGDTLGGLITWGTDTASGTSEYSAGIRAIATQNFNLGHGAKVVVEVVPNGSTSPTRVYTFDQDGTLNAPVALKVAGNQVVSTRKTKPTQTTRAAGAAYTANEQALLNELKNWADAVNTALSAAAGGHGLWT